MRPGTGLDPDPFPWNMKNLHFWIISWAQSNLNQPAVGPTTKVAFSRFSTYYPFTNSIDCSPIFWTVSPCFSLPLPSTIIASKVLPVVSMTSLHSNVAAWYPQRNWAFPSFEHAGQPCNDRSKDHEYLIVSGEDGQIERDWTYLHDICMWVSTGGRLTKRLMTKTVVVEVVVVVVVMVVVTTAC